MCVCDLIILLLSVIRSEASEVTAGHQSRVKSFGDAVFQLHLQLPNLARQMWPTFFCVLLLVLLDLRPVLSHFSDHLWKDFSSLFN